MFYPQWNNTTSYPVNSIVVYNGLLYQATYYHNPASTAEPNVEMGTDPYDPTFFGSQRAWTLYATLPAGGGPTPFVPTTNILVRQVDPNDQYSLMGQYAPGVYGNDQGYSTQEYAGSVNNPTIPCPADKCVVAVSSNASGIYGNAFQLVKELVNPYKPAGSSYYISGGLNPPGTLNTLYVWWGIQAAFCFRRSVKLYCETTDALGNTSIVDNTFVPSDNEYNVGLSTPIQWFEPGNQSVTFTSYSGFSLQNAFDIAPND
jgi:hypothetical protein